MPLTVIDCTDKDRWDRFVRESPHGSIFCLTPFLDALGEEYRLIVVEENGEPQAGVVLILDGGQPIPRQYALTMYQGVLLSASLCRLPVHGRTKQTLNVLEALLAELEKNYCRLVLLQHYRFEDLRGFSWFHYHEPQFGRFRLDPQYTGLLDLPQAADIERYLASIRTVRRQEYRRCQTNGFLVRASSDVEMLVRLHGLTYARQGAEPYSGEMRLLPLVSRAALEKGFGELLTCVSPDGTVTSAALFLFDWRCAYYWVAANDPEYRKTGCSTYLMIESICRCQSKGLATLDFVGINSPNRGDFKTSFNPTPVPYFIATWERPTHSSNC